MLTKISDLRDLTQFELDYILFLVSGPDPDSPYQQEAMEPGPLNTAKVILVAESCRRNIEWASASEVLKVVCSSKLNYLEEALEFITMEAKKLEGLRA